MKFIRSPEPTLILAVTDPHGTPISSPLFAAIKLTASLFDRARALTRLCAEHRIERMSVLEVAPPVYWDIAANAVAEQVFDGDTRWTVQGTGHNVELWGRRRTADGKYTAVHCLAVSVHADISLLESLREQTVLVEFLVDDRGHEQLLGQPFSLAVHARMVALHMDDDEPD